MATTLVKWIGAGTLQQRLGKHPEHYKTHDPNCSFVLAQEQKTGPFPTTLANHVPAHIGRCLKCGGGR